MSTVYIHKPFPGVRKQPAVFLFLVLLHPQINMDFPVGIKPLCGFFPAPAPRAILHEHRRMCQAAPVLFIPYFQSLSKLRSCPSRYGKRLTGVRRILLFLCDPVGIRTQDPQLRRLLLYPAELPDRPLSLLICHGSESGCKDSVFYLIGK